MARYWLIVPASLASPASPAWCSFQGWLSPPFPTTPLAVYCKLSYEPVALLPGTAPQPVRPVYRQLFRNKPFSSPRGETSPFSRLGLLWPLRRAYQVLQVHVPTYLRTYVPSCSLKLDLRSLSTAQPIGC